MTTREMTGFFNHLTPAQQKAALEYRGPENTGMPCASCGGERSGSSGLRCWECYRTKPGKFECGLSECHALPTVRLKFKKSGMDVLLCEDHKNSLVAEPHAEVLPLAYQQKTPETA